MVAIALGHLTIDGALTKTGPRGVTPAKRKRPWGAGVSVVNLGVVGVLNIHVATLGGCKEPREFREFSFTVRQSSLNS